ncbi:partial Bifunctional NAD(P)H-hydrate repair enzyme Nnr, partial [Candidatus Brocadiaceae bacterium]
MRLPTKLYRNEQIRAFDRLAIEQEGIPSFKLMTRAGYALFQYIRNHYPKAHSFAVFCGSGNNSGDGYIVARLLLREGFKVCIYTVADPEKLRGDALTAYHHYMLEKGELKSFDETEYICADIIIDALFGLGLARPIEGIYAKAVEKINEHHGLVLAIDVPSGINADTGGIMGCAVKADVTVTFIGVPQGLLTGYAPDYCGEIIYASLDIPESVLATQKPSAMRVLPKLLPRRLRCSHKGDYGHVLVIGGDQGYTGAARLAGEAALRCGAGLVSIATRNSHAVLLNAHRPELMCHGVETAEALKILLEKVTVVAIGTGLGQHTWAKTLLTATLNTNKPLIVDADALNL